MLEKYINNQEIVTKLLMQSLKDAKIVQAYLFCCDDIDFIYNYAKDFTKDIISLSNLDEKVLDNIYKRIDKEEYTELKIIEPDGNYIKKEQLAQLQNSVLNKPIEGNKIVYIIKNCDKLNISSANSILKFLEEPEDDIIAILLTDNINMVIPTIKSRCQILNFKSVKNNLQDNQKLYKYIFENIEDLDEETLKIFIENSINVIETIENKGKNTFIYLKKIVLDIFKTPNDILHLLNSMIYFYTDCLYYKLGKNINYFLNYEEKIVDISNKNEENQLVKKISIIEEIKNYNRSNVNSKLLFDKLIIEMSEV